MRCAALRLGARRLALPELDDETFIGSLKALLEQDSDWVPTPAHEGEESSLYLRPFMIASESFLGVRPSKEVDYYVIASPAAAYFKGGVAPVSIWRNIALWNPRAAHSSLPDAGVSVEGDLKLAGLGPGEVDEDAGADEESKA